MASRKVTCINALVITEDRYDARNYLDMVRHLSTLVSVAHSRFQLLNGRTNYGNGYDPTGDDRNHTKLFCIGDHRYMADFLEMNVIGAEEYPALRAQWFRSSDAVVLAYNVSSIDSFERLKSWSETLLPPVERNMSFVRKKTGEIVPVPLSTRPTLIIGIQYPHLPYAVPEHEVESFVSSHSQWVFGGEVHPVTGQNVQESIDTFLNLYHGIITATATAHEDMVRPQETLEELRISEAKKQTTWELLAEGARRKVRPHSFTQSSVVMVPLDRIGKTSRFRRRRPQESNELLSPADDRRRCILDGLASWARRRRNHSFPKQ